MMDEPKVFCNIVIEKIKNAIINSPLENPFLMDEGGKILFLFHYSHLNQDSLSYNIAVNRLENLILYLNQNNPISANYSTGVAGIGWLLSYCKKYFVNIEEDIFDDIDEITYAFALDTITKGNYDYLHGALGIVLYFLSQEDGKNNLKIEIILNELFNQIEIQPNNGIAWKTYKYDILENTYDFGLSHGIPSILVILAKCYQKNILKKKCLDSINNVITFLLNQRRDFNDYKSYFPYSSRQKDLETSSRLAWCYGDLGVCFALYYAAETINHDESKKIAIKILLDSTTRRDLEQNLVFDGGLCHGTSGIAHIYNKLFKKTNISNFKIAADYWYQQTCLQSKFEDGIVGYKMCILVKGEPMKYVNAWGLLEGVSGIGLVLLSASSVDILRWDECLLLS